MHLSVIFFAAFMAFITAYGLNKKDGRDAGKNLIQMVASRPMLFELSVILGVVFGILIDLLVGEEIFVKLLADTVLIPIAGLLFIRPFMEN